MYKVSTKINNVMTMKGFCLVLEFFDVDVTDSYQVDWNAKLIFLYGPTIQPVIV